MTLKVCLKDCCVLCHIYILGICVAKLGSSKCELSLLQEEVAEKHLKSANYQENADSLSGRLELLSTELKRSVKVHSHDNKRLDAV